MPEAHTKTIDHARDFYRELLELTGRTRHRRLANQCMTELQRLRDKLEEIEAEIAANRLQINALTARQTWLAMQRSECWKAIARLTLAREKTD